MSKYKYGHDKEGWHITIYFKHLQKENLIKKFILALADVEEQIKMTKVVNKILNKIPGWNE